MKYGSVRGVAYIYTHVYIDTRCIYVYMYVLPFCMRAIKGSGIQARTKFDSGRVFLQ